MAEDESSTPKHGRPAAGRHAAPRPEVQVSEDLVNELFEAAVADARAHAAEPEVEIELPEYTPMPVVDDNVVDVAPVEMPVEAPAPVEMPVEAPAPVETPAAVPAPVELPMEIPAPVETSVTVPAHAEMLGESSAAEPAPAAPSVPVAAPAHAADPAPAETPAPVEVPLSAEPDIPVASAVPEEVPMESPVPADMPSNAPMPPVAGQSEDPTPITQVDADQELSMGSAPTPIDASPQVTGSFARITADQGARVTTRANVGKSGAARTHAARPIEAVRMSSSGRPHVERHEADVESNTRVFAIIGVAVAIVVAVVGWMLVRALVSVEEPAETVVAEQVQVGVGEDLEYRGVTYKIIQQDGGVYALTSTSEDQEGATTVCTLPGTPVALILYNTAFVIPENLNNNTWDLIAHHLGSGSLTQQVTDQTGGALIGEGQIESARLEGTAIVITTTEGQTLTVALE